ncbi:hypothetical protein RchiOBHm_Chr2g0135731 [Rosa chinensis]|uniref:Uncharacterized protein n=1 Tax=Rosa chinensis TaxID=74649 RepID=A0A2P6RW62_ROSCH|nr:hypothetical protein RchiOBHm_Chr2g0135731 [Rosa chinensis]
MQNSILDQFSHCRFKKAHPYGSVDTYHVLNKNSQKGILTKQGQVSHPLLITSFDYVI